MNAHIKTALARFADAAIGLAIISLVGFGAVQALGAPFGVA